ncbi:MAG: hypothetical protein AB2693_29575 [Candidatus Thiodiazotropha sp.]
MPRNSVVRLTDHPDMTLAVELDVKQQNNKQQNLKLYMTAHENDEIRAIYA